MTEPVRLSKRLAEMLGCSRREAELYIEGGWVRVNGEIVDEPFFRVTDETIVLHPQAVAEPLPPVTLLLNKPEGFGAMGGDQPAVALLLPEHRMVNDPSPMQPLFRHLQRQSPVTPLECDASGLIVFTQDWRAQRRLEEDHHLLEQEILVDVVGEITEPSLRQLSGGLSFEGVKAPAMKVSRQSEQRLRFAVKGYETGLIADLCWQVGLEVTAMKRLRIGRVSLSGLPVGQWRYLGPGERF